MVNGRSNALPGIVAAALLWGALTCGPAQANLSTDGYAFGNTDFPQDYAKLILQEGSQTVTITDGGFQGWVSSETFNFTSPDPVDTGYLAGIYGGSPRNNFFVFNLAGLDRTVTSATLNLYAGTISAELNYSLYGATQAITQLSDSASPDLALYDQLQSGQKYCAINIAGGSSLQNLILTLNAQAVSDINAIITSRQLARFAISGHVEPVPELSTWIMMLAGFAGISLAACRRAARGRRAVSAG